MNAPDVADHIELVVLACETITLNLFGVPVAMDVLLRCCVVCSFVGVYLRVSFIAWRLLTVGRRFIAGDLDAMPRMSPSDI